MECCKGKIVFKSEKGNGPKEIHGPWGFGAFCAENLGHKLGYHRKNGHACCAIRGPIRRKLGR